jgi:uroporphyrin-III C-methyltransferase
MPVAMIENASLPHQRECRSHLGAMEQDAQMFQLKSPAILVFGRVAAASAAQQLLETDVPAMAAVQSGR